MDIHKVLVRPTITEKSTILQESGKYTFQVAPRANKVEVKQAVETNFNVTVSRRQYHEAAGQAQEVRRTVSQNSPMSRRRWSR